jgi:hypothetical protein
MEAVRIASGGVREAPLLLNGGLPSPVTWCGFGATNRQTDT